MPKLIQPDTETIVKPHSTDPEQAEHALGIFQLAEEFLVTNTALYYDNTGRLNRSAETKYRHDPSIRLSVWAGVARSVMLGTNLAAISLEVIDDSGDMTLSMKRKNIKHYSLKDDPFVNHIEGFFKRHLA